MVQVVVGRQRHWDFHWRREMDWSVVVWRFDFLLMREESLVAGDVERIDERVGCWGSCLARFVDSLRGRCAYYLLRREVDCFESSFAQVG